jgi:hypothetical protein
MLVPAFFRSTDCLSEFNRKKAGPASDTETPASQPRDRKNKLYKYL